MSKRWFFLTRKAEKAEKAEKIHDMLERAYSLLDHPTNQFKLIDGEEGYSAKARYEFVELKNELYKYQRIPKVAAFILKADGLSHHYQQQHE